MPSGAIITTLGLAKLASATPLNQLNISALAVGDGNGGYPVLDPSMTSLTNEVWRGTPSPPIRDPNSPNVLIFEAVIPPNVGGFTVREQAIFDDAGDMIAIGQTSVVEKPLPNTSTGVMLTVRLHVQLNSASQVDLFFQDDPTISAVNVSNANGGSVQDFIDAQYTTVAELATGKFQVGQYVRLTDRAMGLFLVQSGGTADGIGILDAGNGNTAEYQAFGVINVLQLGAKSDCWLDDAGTIPNPTPTDNYPIFARAKNLKGVIDIPYGNGYLFSGRIEFVDKVVYGNGSTLIPHNFVDDYSIRFHNVKINDLKMRPRDWGVNSFAGRPYLVTFTSVLDRCDFTAFQKSQLFFDDLNADPKVQPYYTEHRECRFRYCKEHNIIVKQGANLVKFYGGITGWAGAPAYMQPPTVEGLYDGILVTRDSDPTPVGHYTPESLVILGMDASYNSRYGFNFDKVSFADISLGYTEYNLKKSLRLHNIIGSQILANKVSDSYDNEIPLLDFGNTDGVARYNNRIVINGQSIGSGSSLAVGTKAVNFELAYSRSLLVKAGCYPFIEGTQEGYVRLSSVFNTSYSEFQLDENFNVKSTKKGHDIQTRTHFFQSSLPAFAGYERTFAYLNSTGELFFCNPVGGWKKVTVAV